MKSLGVTSGWLIGEEESTPSKEEVDPDSMGFLAKKQFKADQEKEIEKQMKLERAAQAAEEEKEMKEEE